MKRIAVCLFFWAFLGTWSSDAVAQNWARRMFKTTSHDFGAVAYWAKTEYRFAFTNTLDRDVHVSFVRTSCGCTTPEISQRTVSPGGQGEIVARFNTDRFQGQRGATLTVVFDRPSYAEVQLRVDGYIRRDVVFQPGSVDFGSVSQGQAVERIIDLKYAGRTSWRIVRIISPDPNLTIQATETRRDSGRVGYRLVARLSENATSGYLDSEITLQTDDNRMTNVPLAVSARIVPALTVSPALLYLGTVQVGQQASGRLVVRGAAAFRVTEVTCDDPRFQFQISDESKTMHLIPVSFSAGAHPGKVQVTIHVHADLNGGAQAESDASVSIVASGEGGTS